MAKPSVLICGGVGFIGRNLVTFLVENDLASFIRVVDKVLPSTAFLGGAHAPAFESPIVEYKQATLQSDAGIQRAYTREDGATFDYVVNLAGETKYGQTEEVYAEKVLGISIKVAEGAVQHGCRKFIEASTAQVYSADKKPSKENGKLSPWTNIAKYKLQAEERLRAMNGLPLIIIRPAVVYGPGDVQGVSPRIICGAVYKHLGEKMKLLWSGDLRMNTVHVRDVCRAVWHLLENGEPGSVFNLADKNDTNQDAVNRHLEAIFGIKTGFFGKMLSNVAKLKLRDVCEEINDKHLKPWSDLCKQVNILNTPLTPYIDQELLYNTPLSIDGSAIESTGFTYNHPQMTIDLIREQVDYYVQQNLFPQV